MENGNRRIWTSRPDFEEYREELREEFPERSDGELQEILLSANRDRLWFDREALTHFYRENILVIADLGLWNGRRSAYREIRSGNLADCFVPSRDTLEIEWFVDRNGDLRCTDDHHDGTNRYLYRVWKTGISEAQKDGLRHQIASGKVSRTEIGRYTDRLGDEIGSVFGWTFAKEKNEGREER